MIVIDLYDTEETIIVSKTTDEQPPKKEKPEYINLEQEQLQIVENLD